MQGPFFLVEFVVENERAGLFDDFRHHRHGADTEAEAADIEGLERIDLAAAFDADDVFARDADAGEAEFVGRRAALAHFLLVFANDKPFGVTINHETGRTFLRAGVQTENAGDMAVGDPHLRAVELVILVELLVAVAADLRDVVDGDALAIVLVVTELRRVVGLVVVLAIINLREIDGRGVDDVFAVRAEHEIFRAVGVGEDLDPFQFGAGLNSAGIGAGAGFGQGERADLAGGDETEKKFVGLGAAVEFGNDGFGAGLERIECGERLLKFALERDEVGTQAGAAGIHEMREKIAGDGAEHRFLADVSLHSFAQVGEDFLHLERFR